MPIDQPDRTAPPATATAGLTADPDVKTQHRLVLSVADQRAFASAILDPPEPGAALRRAASAYRRLVATRG